MRRRAFVGLLSGMSGLWQLAATAQQRGVPTIGFVAFGTREASMQALWYRALHEGLESHGWLPGRNLRVEYRFGDDDPVKLVSEVRNLVRLQPDAIVVPTRPALPIVRDATTKIPVVFVSLGDPLAEGWVNSLARPGGNLTGVAGLSPEIAGKRLELLRELIPSVSKVALLWNPANSAEAVAIQVTRAAAQEFGISIAVERASAPREFEHALRAIKDGGAQPSSCCPIQCSLRTAPSL